jgi:hypothetical protein
MFFFHADSQRAGKGILVPFCQRPDHPILGIPVFGPHGFKGFHGRGRLFIGEKTEIHRLSQSLLTGVHQLQDRIQKPGKISFSPMFRMNKGTALAGSVRREKEEGHGTQPFSVIEEKNIITEIILQGSRQSQRLRFLTCIHQLLHIPSLIRVRFFCTDQIHPSVLLLVFFL